MRGPQILLVAVGLVVFLVSLPLLRNLALKENEQDALRALGLMGREVFAGEGQIGQQFNNVGELLREGGDLAKRLPDTRLLAGGQVMYHHGYLFDLVPHEDGGRVLRAWPMAHGETGLGVFISDGSGRLLGHANSTALWSGMDRAPSGYPGLAASPEASAASMGKDGWCDLDGTSPPDSGL